MNFIDATNQMLNGKMVVRPKWQSTFYLSILNNQNYIWHVDNGTDKPSVNASIYSPTVDDILANDWIVKT
jgi:hypothetical protein